MRGDRDRGEECRGFVQEQAHRVNSPAAADIPESLAPHTASEFRQTEINVIRGHSTGTDGLVV